MIETRRTRTLGRCILTLTALMTACGGDPNAVVSSTTGSPTTVLPPGAAIGQPTAPTGVAGSAATVSPPAIASGAAGAAAPATAAPGAAAAAPMSPAATGAATGAVAPGGESGWCGVKQTLDSRCTVCHNEMKLAGAPMSLKTYADLMAPAPSDPSKKVYDLVKVRVHDKARPMPPQNPLTAEQLSGIDAWVAGGAAASGDVTCPGNKVEETTAAAWPENCDETYTIMLGTKDNPQMIQAGAEIHPQQQVAPPWGSEAIQAIAWRAKNDNLKVLHHWILYGQGGEFIFGWAPGKDNNEPLPPDVGVWMPGTPMRLDIHYNNLQGTATEKDASGVEICALKKANFRPKTATTTNSLTSFLINVPARATGVEITQTCNHSGQPFRLLSSSPHAHRFAKHMKFTVTKASGETIVLHDMPFNFEEQTTYPLTPPVEIVSGDRITTTCTFDNDSDRTVTFGENTGNEMCFNFALYEPMGAISCSGQGVTPRF
jgi:hypothetical protein